MSDIKIVTSQREYAVTSKVRAYVLNIVMDPSDAKRKEALHKQMKLHSLTMRKGETLSGISIDGDFWPYDG